MKRIEFSDNRSHIATDYEEAWNKGRQGDLKLLCECGHGISWHGAVSGKCYGHWFKGLSKPKCDKVCMKFKEESFDFDVVEMRESLGAK